MDPACGELAETSSTCSSASSTSSSSSSSTSSASSTSCGDIAPYATAVITSDLLRVDNSSRPLLPPPYSCPPDRHASKFKATERKAQPRQPRVRVRTLVCAAVVINVLCLGVLVVTAALMVSFRGGQTDAGSSPQHEEVCMPCDEIRPNPLADSHSPLLDQLDIKRGYHDGQGRKNDNALDVDLDTEICCARTPAQYAALFKLILQRQEEVKKLADVLQPEQPFMPAPQAGSHGDSPHQDPNGVPPDPRHRAVAAHLVLKPHKTVAGQERHVQHWKSSAESPLSYVRGGGLAFQDNNRIIVRSPGLYFIYCQILMSKTSSAVDGRSSRAAANSVASSYVMRHSLSFPASSGILLKARHTSSREDPDRHSSYVGGLFFLHKGDQLYVKVSQPSVISHDSRGSFFGLFKIGG